jgi:hypothetical protein
MSLITPEARQRCASHTLQEQLQMMRELELLIARKRIDESYQRILADADEALDIKHDTHEGGQ